MRELIINKYPKNNNGFLLGFSMHIAYVKEIIFVNNLYSAFSPIMLWGFVNVTTKVMKKYLILYSYDSCKSPLLALIFGLYFTTITMINL